MGQNPWETVGKAVPSYMCAKPGVREGRLCTLCTPRVSRRHVPSLLSTRPTSLRRSFIHAIEGHYEVIYSAQRV